MNETPAVLRGRPLRNIGNWRVHAVQKEFLEWLAEQHFEGNQSAAMRHLLNIGIERYPSFNDHQAA